MSVNGVNVPVNATNFIFAASWTNGVQLRTTSIVVPAGATIVVVVSGIIANPNPFSGSYTFNWRTATDQGGAIQSYSNNLLSVNNSSIKDEVISVTPNPTGDFVQILGLKSTEKFYVFDILGKEIKSGVISDNEKINLQDVTSGVYFLKVENNRTIKIIRN